MDNSEVTALISNEAPHWTDLPITPIRSSGTDNAMFRLGETLAIRVPKRPEAVPLLEKEARALPLLGQLPLAVPRLHHEGLAEPFLVVDWIDGEDAWPEQLSDPVEAAFRLATFIKALWQCPTAGAPQAGPANMKRGVPLAEMDSRTRNCIAALADELAPERACELWEQALNAPTAEHQYWLHGDLKSDNMIARDGQLVGVVDWGLAAVGDRAADLAVAWRWVTPNALTAFKTELAVEQADWNRAAGWALYGAVIGLEFYRETPERPSTNPVLCAGCRAVLARLDLLR